MADRHHPADEVALTEASHQARGRTASDRLGPGGEANRPILGLQHTAGNAAVSRLLAQENPHPETDPARAGSSSETDATTESGETSHITFQAVLSRRAPPGPDTAGVHRDASSNSGRRDADAEEGAEQSGNVDPAAITEAFTLPAAAIPSAEAGETVSLPDLLMPESLKVVDKDAIAGTIAFSPTVTQAGAVDPFGATSWSTFNITGTTVTAAAGTFTAGFTLENPITYNVASPKTSIASENDAALTNTNYPTAASDLTPNMAVQAGKPPRTKFWARDLTLRHEGFHSNERSRLNRAGAVQAQAWLNSQTAASVADVQALIAQVPGRVRTASQAAVGTLDEKESRAYGDGAASYQARADAIRTKGALGTAAGGYP